MQRKSSLSFISVSYFHVGYTGSINGPDGCCVAHSSWQYSLTSLDPLPQSGEVIRIPVVGSVTGTVEFFDEYPPFPAEPAARNFYRISFSGTVSDTLSMARYGFFPYWTISAPFEVYVGTPEPGTISLLALGLAGLVARVRRRT